MAPRLRILSPKRNKRLQTGWEGFFPYYAGFPELFARELLRSAMLPCGAVILDPWNDTGTQRKRNNSFPHHRMCSSPECAGPARLSIWSGIRGRRG